MQFARMRTAVVGSCRESTDGSTISCCLGCLSGLPGRCGLMGYAAECRTRRRCVCLADARAGLAGANGLAAGRCSAASAGEIRRGVSSAHAKCVAARSPRSAVGSWTGGSADNSEFVRRASAGAGHHRPRSARRSRAYRTSSDAAQPAAWAGQRLPAGRTAHPARHRPGQPPSLLFRPSRADRSAPLAGAIVGRRASYGRTLTSSGGRIESAR